MSDWYLLLGPLALLPVVALLAFVGCVTTGVVSETAPARELVLSFHAPAADAIAFVRFGFGHPPGDRFVGERGETTLTTPTSSTSLEQTYERRFFRPAPATWTVSCEVGGLPGGPGSTTTVDLAAERRGVGITWSVTDAGVTLEAISVLGG